MAYVIWLDCMGIFLGATSQEHVKKEPWFSSFFKYFDKVWDMMIILSRFDKH